MNERRSRYARILRQILIAPPMLLIWVYRHGISPFTPPSCRFTPTCSQYFAEALRRHGLLKGSYLGGCCAATLGEAADTTPYRNRFTRKPRSARPATETHRCGTTCRPVGPCKPVGRKTDRRNDPANHLRTNVQTESERGGLPGIASYRKPAPSAIKPRRFQAPADPGPLHVGHPIRPYRTRHNTGQDTAGRFRLLAGMSAIPTSAGRNPRFNA